MTLVNGLCISVLEDAYHFSLTSSSAADAPLSTVEISVPFSSTFPDALDGVVRLLKSKFANLNADSQTIFCHPSTIRTVHRRTIMSILTQLGLPSLRTEPIAFRQAYSAALSVTELSALPSILFVECTPEESGSELVEFELQSDGTFLEIQGDFFSVFHRATEDISAIAEEVRREVVAIDMSPAPTRLVVFSSLSTLAKAVERTLTTAYPSTPVYIPSPADLSKGAAKFPLPDPHAPRVRVTATYVIPLPVSIECADGSAVIAVPFGRKLRPVDESVLFTTSVNNQTSVTVRISLGDHPRAEDNLLSGTVVLDGLVPMPRGEAIIRVTLVIGHSSGATAIVEQVIDQKSGSAPRNIVVFSDLIRYLGSDYERFGVVEGKPSAVFIEDSVIPVGELPA